jgi:hypothetical protein
MKQDTSPDTTRHFSQTTQHNTEREDIKGDIPLTVHYCKYDADNDNRQPEWCYLTNLAIQVSSK